jgi:hypothetical protein
MSKRLVLTVPSAALSEIGSRFATFPISYRGRQFLVNPILAGSSSSKLASLFQSDPLCTEFTYETTLSGDFNPVCKCLNCIPFEVTPTSSTFLLKVSAELQISKLTDAVVASLPEEAITANNFETLRLLYENGGKCDSLLSVIASHFERLDRNALKKLPGPLLDLLLKSPTLLINDRRTIVELFREIFDWGKQPNHRLAKYLPFSIMDEVDVVKILGNPRLNMNTMKYALLRADAERALKSGSS